LQNNIHIKNEKASPSKKPTQEDGNNDKLKNSKFNLNYY
jgi:hypothetical protein